MKYFILVNKELLVKMYIESKESFVVENEEGDILIEVPKQDKNLFTKQQKLVLTENNFHFEEVIDDWEYLQFTDETVNSASIISKDGQTTLLVDNKEWMNNSKFAVMELGEQYDKAYGNVLIGGLGLGILALLVASKPEVDSVTVIENNSDIIYLFNSQSFSKNKINIINSSIYEHQGSYDVALLDYYNREDITNNFFKNEKEKLSTITADVWDWYLEDKQLNKVYSNERLLPEIMINLIRINSLAIINKLTEECFSALYSDSRLPFDENTLFHKDYFIYNIDKKIFQAVGITWVYNENTYSIKYQYGKITDLYIIYESNHELFSSELDIDTKEIVCSYPHKGDNKVDLDGNIIQVNTKIDSLSDLPAEVTNTLIEDNFQFMDRIFYYGVKPYGKVIEVSFPEDI